MSAQPVIRIRKFTGTVRYPRQKAKAAWFFRLVAANGEIIAQSEAYTRKASRDRTVRLLLRGRMEEV
jgi:uncharacterized protein YegP (UPF0339 family)